LIRLDLISCKRYIISIGIFLCRYNRLCLNCEVDDDRASVDRDDLDPVGWDTKRGRQSIDEAGGATFSEELIHGPVHTHLGLNRVLRLNQEVATGLQPELEEVLDTNESVLATALSLE